MKNILPKRIKSNRSDFQMTIHGKQTDIYFLKNKHGLEAAVTNFGGRLVELWVPDKEDAWVDIVLGHATLAEYVHYQGERFLGATIGRYGNRIAKGQLMLAGKMHQLPINDGTNSLHGGFKGFDMVVWEVEQVSEREIVLSYLSKDGEEGYPGNLHVVITYCLTDDNEWHITYRATTDKPTVINLTHHSFFNLHGESNGHINDHYLTVNADRYLPVNTALIPNGQCEAVKGTPMDFRMPMMIGDRLNDHFQQLHVGHGYDHNWVLNRKTKDGLELAATVYEAHSGRYMEVWTTEPGIQFYGGNFFDGKSTVGKSGKAYPYRGGLALETQHFPDSPNHPDYPSTVLRPGETYHHTCVYKFDVK